MRRYLHPSELPEEADAHRQALERLLRDLKVGASPAADGYPDYGKRGWPTLSMRMGWG